MARPTDRCLHCHRRFKLKKDNTVAWIFTNPGQEDFNYITSVCPHCEVKNWTFMYQHIRELEIIIKTTECEVIVQPFASSDIVNDFNAVHDIRLPARHPLSNDEKRLVAFWAYLLTDEELLWSEIEGTC